MDPATTTTEVGPGTVIAETYRIVSRLGEGGMGVVFEAEHLRVPRRVAIKVLRAQPTRDQFARFRQEAEVTSRLRHEGIIDIIDFNTLPSGAAYIVMELLEGESLAARLRDRGALPVEEVLPIVRQIASALHAAHCAGIVHRDLKPANVYLIKREHDGVFVDHVTLLDFGISKVHGSSIVRTAEDVVLGTPRYMAPEQALGRNEHVDPRCDQFALGVMAYEMLTGSAPFDATNTTQVMFQIAYETPTPLATLVPDVDPQIVNAIERAMSKQPDDRFGDLPQFIAALTGRPLADIDRSSYPVLSATRLPERPDRNASTVPSKPRRRNEDAATVNERLRPTARRRIALLGIGVVAVVVAALVIVTRKESRPIPQQPPVFVSNDATVATTHDVDAAGARDPAMPVDAAVARVPAMPVDAAPVVSVPPSRTHPTSHVPAEAADALGDAEAALREQDFERADRAARLALRYASVARAYEILVELACIKHDGPAVHGWLRNLPRRRWPQMHARCRARGFESTDPSVVDPSQHL